MARYEKGYGGERRSVSVRSWLTPSERETLARAAAKQGAPTLSEYVRDLCLRRSAAVVAATRRNPEAKAVADQLRAAGNNLNQIARHLNTTGDLRDWGELREALRDIKVATARVLDL